MNESDSWLAVAVSAEAQAIESVANFLFENGSLGVEEKEGKVIGYFPGDMEFSRFEARLILFIQSLSHLGLQVGSPLFRKFKDEDWSKKWRRFFRPVRVGSHFIARPPWASGKSGRDDIVLNIMPRMAFGTGTHESTKICLVFLETILLQSQTVLDLGTGSGILAIAAAKLGAARVLAVDIDEVCMANARENTAANHVNKVVEVRLGSLESTGSETFDLVMANINRNVIIPLLPEMKQTLNKDGRIMLSGILESEKLLIEKAVHDCGCEILNQKQMGEWIGFVTSQQPH